MGTAHGHNYHFKLIDLAKTVKAEDRALAVFLCVMDWKGSQLRYSLAVFILFAILPIFVIKL